MGAYLLKLNAQGQFPRVIGKKVMDKNFGSENTPLEPLPESNSEYLNCLPCNSPSENWGKDPRCLSEDEIDLMAV